MVTAVRETDMEGWWKGCIMVGDVAQEGLFPSSFVSLIQQREGKPDEEREPGREGGEERSGISSAQTPKGKRRKEGRGGKRWEKAGRGGKMMERREKAGRGERGVREGS